MEPRTRVDSSKEPARECEKAGAPGPGLPFGLSGSGEISHPP
jgi:hypothetical protein